MTKLTINDFEIGDKVHQSINTSLLMVVIEISIERNEVVCRWLDKIGNSQKQSFIPQELIKEKPYSLGIYLRE